VVVGFGFVVPLPAPFFSLHNPDLFILNVNILKNTPLEIEKIQLDPCMNIPVSVVAGEQTELPTV